MLGKSYMLTPNQGYLYYSTTDEKATETAG